LDIKASLVGMHQEWDITRLAGQRLKCQDPRIVKKYNEQMDKMIQQHNIVGQVAKVYQDRVAQLTQNQLVELEEIDLVITKNKLVAEKQCRKFMPDG